MQFKVLRHKQHPELFGYVDSVAIGEYEVVHGTVPNLLLITATMEGLKNYWLKHNKEIIVQQLEDYDLVTVEVKIIDGAKPAGPNEFGYVDYKSYMESLLIFATRRYRQNGTELFDAANDNTPVTHMQVVEQWITEEGFG